MTNHDAEHNGSGLNGSGDPDKNENERQIIKFPTLAERDRLRREKLAEQEAWRRQYKKGSANNAPFLNVGNIPLFVKITAPLFIAIHALIWAALSNAEIMDIYLMFGFIPASYTAAPALQALWGPLSHIFIHGGWTHLIFNVIMFTALGTFFAREFGDKVALVFFLAGALGGALLFFYVHPVSSLPLIGASGGINALFAAFLIVMYKRGAFGQFKAVRKYGAMPIIGFWLGLILFLSLIGGGGQPQAWEAHIGGFITGLLLLSWIVKKDPRFWRF